jgi:hypothetical protein
MSQESPWKIDPDSDKFKNLESVANENNLIKGVMDELPRMIDYFVKERQLLGVTVQSKDRQIDVFANGNYEYRELNEYIERIFNEATNFLAHRDSPTALQMKATP